MGFSAFYSSSRKTDPENAKTIIHHAVSKGVSLFNSATFYGPLNEEGFGANLRLLRSCIEGLDRSKIQLMVKVGMDTRAPMDKTGTKWELKGDAESIRKDVEFALEQLGTDYLDVIVMCRFPKDVSVEECVLGLKAMVDAGKVRHIGLSEASAQNIRAANAVYPIYCIEQEWSLWARDIEEEIVPTCRELGIKIVAYCPLGRGFLTGQIRSRSDPVLDPFDYRLHSPKFEESNLETNLNLIDSIKHIAERKDCSLGQLSLAWLHSKGPDVIPIPGTTNIDHFNENYNALDIQLTSEEIEEINNVFTPTAPAGLRYPHNHMTFHTN